MKANRKLWLLLDDDRALLEIVSTLAELWGKDSIQFRNGSEAMTWLKAFQDGHYDGPVPELALLDIRMPGGPQGDEVAREMRRTPGLRPTAIVMMTANFLDIAQESTLLEATGADGFIRKPFPVIEDFKSALDGAIRKRALHIGSGQGQTTQAE